MSRASDLKKFFKCQTDLAKLLGGGLATRATRIKAHRIWQGGNPNRSEIAIISQATGGTLDGNYFCGLPALQPEHNINQSSGAS